MIIATRRKPFELGWTRSAVYIFMQYLDNVNMILEERMIVIKKKRIKEMIRAREFVIYGRGTNIVQ